MKRGRLVIVEYSAVFPDEHYGAMSDSELFDIVYENLVGVTEGVESVELVEENGDLNDRGSCP